jgi:hypothetical protein
MTSPLNLILHALALLLCMCVAVKLHNGRALVSQNRRQSHGIDARRRQHRSRGVAQIVRPGILDLRRLQSGQSVRAGVIRLVGVSGVELTFDPPRLLPLVRRG